MVNITYVHSPQLSLSHTCHGPRRGPNAYPSPPRAYRLSLHPDRALPATQHVALLLTRRSRTRYGGLMASAAQVDPSAGERYAIDPSGTDMIVTYGNDGQVAVYNPGDMCVPFARGGTR